MLVSLAYLYNFISIPLRIAFPIWKKGEKNIWLWMLIDYLCDVLYLIDICFVQTRIKYLENGLWVVSIIKDFLKKIFIDFILENFSFNSNEIFSFNSIFI
jgi:hypothetical protein